MAKSREAFRTISEVADALGTQPHVLRFWESKFAQIKPVKRAGGRRYYRPADMALLSGIKQLLHEDGLTIKGVQKILRERGVKYVAALAEDAPIDIDAVEVAPDENVVQLRKPEKAPEPQPSESDVVEAEDAGQPGLFDSTTEDAAVPAVEPTSALTQTAVPSDVRNDDIMLEIKALLRKAIAKDQPIHEPLANVVQRLERLQAHLTSTPRA